MAAIDIPQHVGLILHGLCRVRFRSWLPDRSFPCARIEPVIPCDLADPQARLQRTRLLDAVEGVLVDYPDEVGVQIRTLFDRSLSPVVIADTVAHQFVRDSSLRQTLLEEPDPVTRIDLIVDYLQTASPGLKRRN